MFGQTMTSSIQTPTQTTSRDWLALAESLGQQFAVVDQAADASDAFVTENFAMLKQSGLTAMIVPTEFGGGGASYADVCKTLQILGRYCSSTALALSMHTHQVMVLTWKWRHQKAPVEGLLRRIAHEQIMLLSSGGGDWLDGSGTATPTEGGYLIKARKGFSSGAPVGDLLMTSAVYADPTNGPTVLHFALPMKTPGVSIEPTWQAMGMRGTGSHDIVCANVYIPEEAIALRRPAGKWHPAFHLITLIAFPIVYSVYVGVAEAARDLAVKQACKARNRDRLYSLVGELENELFAARTTLQQMVTTDISSQPSFETTNQIMMGRTLVAKSVLNVVDQAMEVAGGRSFHRPFGLEKLFRDAQGARFHPLREDAQRQLAGQLAMGIDRALL